MDYKFKRFYIRQENEEMPNGSTGMFEYMIHNGGVIILAIYDGKIAMIREYRSSIKKYIYELPAGTLEKNEAPIERARKELMEEAGLVADSKNIRLLFKSYPSIGVSNEMQYFCLAFPEKKQRQRLERHEVIKVEFITLDKAMKMIKDNRIINGPMIQAVLFYNEFISKKDQ
ncbi:MAG: NUDIX hydrolase [Candidatus Marsarchaeota archaeon]|nr:NUDIX hydrolase [Candidatus Marsarchaeota archaeon]